MGGLVGTGLGGIFGGVGGGASLCFAMVLAAGYAFAQQFGFRWLDLEMMERIHGMANAFGFALCGLIGWSRIDCITSRKDEPLCVSP